MKRSIIGLSILAMTVIPSLAFAEASPQECNAGIKDSFAVYLAKSAVREGQPPLADNDPGNFTIIGKSPVITGSEIESVKTQGEKGSEATDRLQLLVTLTKSGAKKVKKVTAKNVGKDLIFEIGQEIISHPRIADGIDSNTFVISMGPGGTASELLKKICK